MKVFSFCLYGEQPKYCQGMIENLKLINEFYSDFYIWIYMGSSVPSSYLEKINSYKNVRMIHSKVDNHSLMNHRFFSIDSDEVEIMFVRDADSRVNERDRWCINKFIQSSKTFHIIRDQFWHKTRITGGMWGCKKGALNQSIESLFNEYQKSRNMNKYGEDQNFLQEKIYPLVSSNVLIHTNINLYKGEIAERIRFKNDNVNFIGNVILIDENGKERPEFTYWGFDVTVQLTWLRAQQAWSIINHIESEIDYSTLNQNFKCIILDEFFISYYYSSRYLDCVRVLSYMKDCNIIDHVIHNSNFLLPTLGKKIIGTLNENLEPSSNEILIVYGDYSNSYLSLPCSNKLFRNIKFKDGIKHDLFI